MHQAIGERLERAYQTDSGRVAAELAAHFEESGDDARAIRYFLKAAHRARRRFADREAEAFLLSALQRLERLPESEERSFQEVLARVELGQLKAFVEQGDRDEEEANSTRATEVAGTMADLPILFPLFRGVWRIAHEVYGPAQSAPLANRLLRLADTNGGTEHRVGAEYATGLVDLMSGSLNSALAHFATAVDCYERDAQVNLALKSYGPMRWKELGVQVLGFSGMALTLGGLVEQGRARGRRALDLCSTERLHPFTEAAFQFVAAGAECLLGELATAQSLNEKARALTNEHQLWKMEAILSLQRGWIEICRGEREAGMALLRDQAELLRQRRATSSYPLAGLYYIDGCRMVGDVGEGFAVLEAIRGECERRGIHWFDAELTRIEAELLMLRGDRRADIASRLRGAIDLAEKQGAALLALRAAISLLRLVPDDPNAHQLLARAHARFQEGSATPLLREAATLKSQLC
jgi:tetratricopeptide (TPR) repeat protein